jgi:uncharacterized protein YgiM (DUF1202 family)
MKARNQTAHWADVSTGGHLFGALSLFAVLALSSAAWAQIDVNIPGRPSSPAGTPAAAPPQTGTVAEVTANDVNIRSGPGTQFYQCGKLKKGDHVQVAKVSKDWSAIVPPPGSYSWIAVQYVSVSIQNATEGVVTGDGVAVYAGSDDLDPMVSTSKQDVTMSRGQKVRLLNEEKDEYYKIVPPAGAYLWVSNQFLLSNGSVGASLPPTEASQTQPKANPGQTPPAATPTEASLLAEYYNLSKQITEEIKKPIEQQDFTGVKGKLKAIADNKDGGRAARYAQYTLKQVERAELAKLAGQDLIQQNEDLKKNLDNIDKAMIEQIGKIPDTSKYIAIGKLQPSALYSTTVSGQSKRYQLVDEAGNIRSYVSPAGNAAAMDMTPFIGHKVGLVGHAQSQAATTKAYVEFSAIDRLD